MTRLDQKFLNDVKIFKNMKIRDLNKLEKSKEEGQGSFGKVYKKKLFFEEIGNSQWCGVKYFSMSN